MNLLDLIFPKDLYCISCGRPLPVQDKGGLALCKRCVDEIHWITGRNCEKCGRPLLKENPGKLCHDCSDGAGHVFSKGYACAVYEGRVAQIIRDMKYHGKSWYAETLSALMAVRFFAVADRETGELPLYDFLLAVPMSAGKKAIRGYDQAALLARGLARRAGVPYLGNTLRRIRETDVMSGLSVGERRQNLTSAFSVDCDMINTLVGKRVLLVDDVYTTGSSVDACAETLLGFGTESVDVMVFAIGADVRRAEDRPAVVESPGQLRAKGPT